MDPLVGTRVVIFCFSLVGCGGRLNGDAATLRLRRFGGCPLFFFFEACVCVVGVSRDEDEHRCVGSCADRRVFARLPVALLSREDKREKKKRLEEKTKERERERGREGGGGKNTCTGASRRRVDSAVH